MAELHLASRQPAPADKAGAMSAEPAIPLILLVEDSEDDAYFFRRVLRDAKVSCKLIHAKDGTTALTHLEKSKTDSEQRPELIFLDLKMPAVDGFEVLTWIRDQEFTPPLSVAVLSGSDREGDIARAKSLGAEHYFVKPVTVEQLRTHLRTAAGETAENIRR